MKRVLPLAAAVFVLTPSVASPCSMVLAPKRLAWVVDPSDVIVVATALQGCSRFESGCGDGHVELEVHRTLKGPALAHRAVSARCETTACEFACFEEGDTYVFFLVAEASGGFGVAGVPLPVDEDGTVQVRPWWWESDVPAQLPLDRFERLVRDPTVELRELPLTFRFRRGPVSWTSPARAP